MFGKAAKGIASGFFAASLLGVAMAIKMALAMLPQLRLPALAGELTGVGPVLGWFVHMAVGMFWGLLFAFAAPYMHGRQCWARGVVFMLGPWLFMMIALMPVAGLGLFASDLGFAGAMTTLLLHLMFGAIMGFIYGELAPLDLEGQSRRSARDRDAIS